MKRLLAAIGGLLLAAACAHHSATTSASAPMEPANQATIITIGNGQAFSPGTVTVRSGSAIYWRNSDRMTHRIVLDDHRYDSADITPGSLGCGLILSDTGTHTYHDLNNPSMTGTIVVTQ